MEEKKCPVLTENFRFKAPDPEPVLLPTERPEPRKRPFSTCLLFLLLGVFVFTLGCFAVYAAISMGSPQTNEINGTEAYSKSLPLEQPKVVFPSNEPVNKPFFHFEIEVNGKKFSGTGDARNKTEIVITHTAKPKVSDEFSTIKNFIKKITGDDRQNIFKPSVGDKNLNEPNPKPKVISIESFEISKLPSEFSVNFEPLDLFDPFPFGDDLDILNPVPPRFNRPPIPVPQNRENGKKEVGKIPKKENPHSKFNFPDIDEILTEFFDFKPDSAPKNKTKSVPPKPFIPSIETFDPFIFPFGFSNKDRPDIFSNMKPREEANSLKKKEKPYLDRYMNEKKPNDDFFNSFFGLNAFKPKKEIVDPDIVLFNIPFGQPKYPKKYQSMTLSSKKDEAIQDNKSNQIETDIPVSTNSVSSNSPKSVQEGNPTTSTPALPQNGSSWA